jgi:uncharacterized RDD family membrane protein YckC
MVGGYAGASVVPDTQIIGRRVVAIIIDGILLCIVGGLISLPSIVAQGGGDGNIVSGALGGLAGLFSFVLFLAYYTFMEGYYGQTLGKMALGIKVIREDSGQAPGFGKAAIRTVLRIIDGIAFYLVGFIVALVSDKNQRLGDMAARTLVVRA